MTVAKQYPLPKAQHPTKEPSWFSLILMSGVISGVILFALGWFFSLPAPHKSEVLHKILSAGDIFPGIIGLDRPKILLVMGVDMPPRGAKDAYKAVRTDTMMLVKLDTQHNNVNIVSIPRDSKVFIAGGHGVDKINAAFTYGGAELATSTVEDAFGVEIDNYLVLNIRGVREFVEALGGVDLYVEKPMYYRDRTAGLNIALQPGQQHLNGREAEGYLRFRHDALGDIGRIRRQQQFVSATIKKLKDPQILLSIKPLLTATNEYTLTDMATPDLVGLVLFAKDLDPSRFQVATLPGHPSSRGQISYWVVDPVPAEAVLNRLILGIRDEVETHAKPTVGILYTQAYQDDIAPYKSILATQGFQVKCQLALRRATTKLVIHNNGLPRRNESKLQQSNPILKHAQLIFSPHGTTFETNACSHSDYTVILGEDTRSATDS